MEVRNSTVLFVAPQSLPVLITILEVLSVLSGVNCTPPPINQIVARLCQFLLLRILLLLLLCGWYALASSIATL